MKIKMQFILAIFLPTLVVCLIIAVFTINSITSHVRFTTQETLQNQVSRYTNEVNVLLNSLSHNAKFIKDSVETTIDLTRFQNDLEYRENYLDQLTANIQVIARKSGLPTGHFVTFIPQLTDSVIISGTQDYDDNGSLEPVQPLSIRYFTTTVNDPQKDWFFKPLQEGKEFWAEPSLKKHALIGHEYISVSYPIFYKRQTIGVAVSEIDFKTIDQLINRFHFHTNGYAMLTDSNYQFLVHPSYSRSDSLLTVENNRYLYMKNALTTYDSGILELTPPKANAQVMAYKGLTNQWVLYLIADKTEILSAVGQMTTMTYSLLGFAIVLSLLLSWAMGRQISKPITMLSTLLSHSLQSNNVIIQNKTLMKRSDEIGILATAILEMNLAQNEMTLKIDDYTLNLNAKVNHRNKDLLGVNSDLQHNRKQLEVQQNELREKNKILEESISDMMHMQQQMIHSEKMASFGYLISGIADEIDIPIEGSLKLIQKMKAIPNQAFSMFNESSYNESAFRESLEILQDYNNYLLKYMLFSKDIIDYIKDIVLSKSNQKKLPILVKDAFIHCGESAIDISTKENVHLIVKCADTLCIQSDPALFSHILFSIFMTIINDTDVKGDQYITVRAIEEGNDLRVTIIANSSEKEHEDHQFLSSLLPLEDADIKAIKMGFNMIHILMQEFFRGEFKVNNSKTAIGSRFTMLFRDVL